MESVALNFTLNDGDDFYVVTNLVGVARYGSADACNTLTVEFSKPTGITAVAVPEPSAALFLAGICGFLRLTSQFRNR